jgi:hypothetical protein
MDGLMLSEQNTIINTPQIRQTWLPPCTGNPIFVLSQESLAFSAQQTIKTTQQTIKNMKMSA